LQVGVAAANGTRAALLARVGSDSGDALFGTRGVFCVTLGEDAREYGRWGDPCDDAVGVLASKPYPCCYLLHPAIDAALEVWSQLDGRPDVEVQSAQVTIGPLAASLANRPAKVGDPLSAKFSAAYCVAQTLSAGHLTVADLREPSQNETVTLTECLDRLTVTIDDCLSPLEAGLRVRLKSGDLLTAHVTGTPSDKRPMSEDELQAKFRDNVSALLTREDALALEDRLTAMSTSGSARQIFSGLRFAR
jgi:2-methylcitrate dehydratase PrpD